MARPDNADDVSVPPLPDLSHELLALSHGDQSEPSDGDERD